MPSAHNAGRYAELVIGQARRRDIASAARALANAAASATLSDEQLEAMQADLLARLTGAQRPTEQRFKPVCLADLPHAEVHAPTYYWDQLVPKGHLTVLSGHGDVGKSLIALMLTVCVALGRPLFGVPTIPGKVAFFSGEDGAELLRHRLLWVCEVLDIDPAELDGKVHLLDATEGDPTLFHEVSREGRRMGMTSATYADLARYIEQHGIDLLIVDNMSDTFDSNEIERPKVRAFLRSLVRLRAEQRMTVLLLAHVDKGTARGERTSNSEAYSGSTAVHNSARSRIFLARDKDGALTLEHQKHNLGRRREPLRLRWPDGGLPTLDTPPNGHMQAIAATADLKALLRLVAEFTARGEYVNPARNSPASAPRLLKLEPSYPKGRKADEVGSMLRDAERDGLLVRENYRGPDRHERTRWTLTGAGRALIERPAGSAGSAGSAGRD